MTYQTNQGSWSALLLFMMICLALPDSALGRSKLDVVWLENGDRVSGEIKELRRGKVRINTDSMGVIYIEWEDVIRVESPFVFQFLASNGMRKTGTFGSTNDSGELVLQFQDGDIALPNEKIVMVAQIEATFLEQLKGNISFGYSFTKASDVAQGNLGFRISHRTEKRSLTLNGSTIVTNDQQSESTQRSDLQFTQTRFRRNLWFNSYVIGLESNDELGLNLRTRLGAGIGRFLFRTDSRELALVGGLIATNEQLQNNVPSENNAEGMMGVEYAHYIFDDPVVDLTSTLSVYPSITQSGRRRAQLDVSLKWELIKDLYWDVSFYNTYDSDPPSGSTSNNDYGIVTSLGYSF